MESEDKTGRRRQRSAVGGVVLVTLGTVFLLQKTGVIDPQLLRQWWPLLLIGVGGWLLLGRRRQPGE